MTKKYLSLLISTIGIIFFISVNYNLAQSHKHLILTKNNGLDVVITRIDLSVQIIFIFIAIISVIIGLMNSKFNKVYNRIGILFSILLIILTFLPLWILWV